MTFGEELLDKLGERIPVNSYLNAEQQEQLKQIDSKDGLKEFLTKNSMRGVSVDGNVSDVADTIISTMRLNRVTGGNCEGCLFLPITLQINWLIDAVRMGKLRFSLAEIMAFVALFAVCLSYEASCQGTFTLLQLLLAVPVGALFGVVPALIFRNPRWMVVGLDLLVLMEVVVYLIWHRS